MKKFFFICLFIGIGLILKSQSLISLKSYSTYGVTDTVDNAPIVVDNASKKVTVSGNTKITGSQYDASTAQQVSNGVMTWTQTFNLSSQKTWVTASITDASGNVYITGGVATGTTNGVDLFVRKYTSTGSTVWTYTYNGPNSTMDVGTGITLDGSNNVYVCGASDGTMTSLTDFVTIKLKGSSGTTLWTPAASRYNYSNSYDAATSISYNSTTARVDVSGPSGTTYTDWDIATVSYKAASGAQYTVTRAPNPGGNEDKAFSMATDTLGNVYVAGTSWNAGNSSYDISLQKLDTALNMVWIKFYDASGLDDVGLNVALDDSLNIYVAGTGYYQDTTLSSAILLKYDKYGNRRWDKQLRPITSGSSAEGIRVKVKNLNEIFLGGNFTSNNNQDMVILRFDSAGTNNLAKTYNGSQNGKDKFLDMAIRKDSNFIYVSGRSYASGSLDSNITLTYYYNDFPRSILSYSGSPARIENELFVSFQPSAIKNEMVNNLNIEDGTLKDFLTPTAMSALDSYFTAPIDNYACYKVFPWMTLDDSVSTTRSGNTVKVNHHWTSLCVRLPSGSPDTAVIGYFKNASSVVEYACFNLIAVNTSTANDPDYVNGNSASLASTTVWAHANINVGPAWDMSTGDPSIVVGIYDTGINQKHPDLGNGVQPGNKIHNGWNYSVGGAGIPLSNQVSNDDRGHGTAIAGIIGANRNSFHFTAGVAGGDWLLVNPGVSLHDMKTALTNTNSCGSYNTSADLVSALLQGALGTPNGLGQHIACHSWTWLWYVDWPSYDALTTAFQNQIFMALASGNNDDENFPCNNLSYPRAYPDRWMTCTGANDTNSTKMSWSECGTNLDVIAPGTAYLYQGLCHTYSCTTDTMYYGNTCANRLDGTSFAAPHTAGLGGLMLSYYKNAGATPNPLDPEDLEEIMQITATDITAPTGSYSVGYDARSGYGRLNAGNAMQAIKFPDYEVKHYSATANATTAVLQGSNEVTCLWKSLFGLPSGTVHVDRYQVTKTVSHSIPSGYTIAIPSYPGWERDGASNIHGLQSGAYSLFCGDLFNMPTHYLPDAPNITTTISATGATLTGYIYAIHDPSNPATKYWWPTYFNNLTGTADFEYSLYLKSLTIGIEENAVSEHALNVYPNPGYDKVYISSNLSDLTKIRVTIYNVLGQVMLNDALLDILEPNYVDVSGLKNGVYFFHLTNGSKKIVKKVIINH